MIRRLWHFLFGPPQLGPGDDPGISPAEIAAARASHIAHLEGQLSQSIYMFLVQPTSTDPELVELAERARKAARIFFNPER